MGLGKFAGLVFGFCLLPTIAMADCFVPAVGTAQRKGVMDTVRKPVPMELKQSVEFLAHKIRICEQDGELFAFLIAALQRPGGAKVDWSITPYADADCSQLVIALLHKRTGMPWSIMEVAICPTDVPWEAWPEQYFAPEGLFR